MQGRHIGFRKMVRGALGTWIARFYAESAPLLSSAGRLFQLGGEGPLPCGQKAADDWFVHPGFLRRYKGTDQLIQSFIDLRRPDTTLVIAGRPIPDSYGEALKSRVDAGTFGSS